MRRTLIFLLLLNFLFPLPVLADDVMVTRHFTGLWDQPEHESQGINLQIIEQPNGDKIGVAYWFTYDDDMDSAWFLALGPVSGNRIEMVLYEGQGIGFLESNAEGNDRVVEVGSLEMEFSSCTDGIATFSTTLPNVGSGTFPVERFTDLFNTSCSGGISDDTPSDIPFTEQRISLSPAREGLLASGHADFKERPDRTEFSVEVEDMADGSYRIIVGGVDRGELVVSMGIGETEFRSPAEEGKVLLTFDPRGQQVEVHDVQGVVLTSGDSVFSGGDDNGGDDQDFGSTEIEVELDNMGVYPAGSGDARLRPRSDRTDFSVEIEDVPVGNYGLQVGGQSVGTINVTVHADGSIEGEIEFRDPVEPGKQLLDFDPRGQRIQVLDGTTVIFDTVFPSA